MASSELIALINELDEQNKAKEAHNARGAEIQARIDELRFNLLPAKMEDEGVESITIQGIGTVDLKLYKHASIVKDHEDQAFAWLREHGGAGIIKTKDSVHWSSLTAHVTKMFQKGIPPPDGVINFKMLPAASIKA